VLGCGIDWQLLSGTVTPSLTRWQTSARVWLPDPQVLLHGLQAPTHWYAQPEVPLHACVVGGAGVKHRLLATVVPSLRKQVSTFVWVPAPQALLHAPKLPTQS
jgi:hypothetical protein